MDENKVVETNSEENKTDIKGTIIKCVAAIVCVAILMVTLAQSVTKMTENNVKVAEVLASANGGSASVDADAPVVDDSTSTDAPVVDDSTATDAPVADDSTSTDAPSADAPSADAPSSNSGAAQASKKPSTKAEIISYFNTASNKVKTSAKSVTKVKEENYQAKPINLGALGALQGAISGLIDDNMGVNEEQSGRTGTSVADKNAIYPVENESWSSKLTEADVKTATCTEKDGVYTITLTLVNDALAKTYSHGTGHHGKAFSIVMPQTIKDNAGVAGSLLGSLKVGYEDGKIVVNVDAATGNIISAKYDFVWLLNIDMFGGITAYFGIRTDYTMKW